MLGSNVLEIAIGMLLIYSILSLICSAITELIAEQFFSLRSKKLNKWIRNALEADKETVTLRERLGNFVNQLLSLPLIRLLTGKQPVVKGTTLGDEIFDHPLLRSLARERDTAKPNKLPQYIPAKTFAMALFNVATKRDSPITSLENFMNSIDKIQNHDKVKQLLQSLTLNVYSGATSEAEKLNAAWMNIETWFDNVMEQATAGYKRHLRLITLLIAFVVCSAINADSLMLVNALANDPAIRSIVVSQAEKFVENPPAQLQPTPPAAAAPETNLTPVAGAEVLVTATPTPEPTLTATPDTITVVQGLQQDLEAIGLFGWVDQYSDQTSDRRAVPAFSDGRKWFFKIIGILITTFAISLGAPFWFDLLNKLVNLRTSGAKPAKAAETEEEKDPKPAGQT